MTIYESESDRLAIDGGVAVRNTPMPPWPSFDEEQVEAVAACLRSGKVNQWTGALVREFEKAFAEKFQAPHAVAVTNGSLAIELALRAFGIGAGDEVIVTPRSFLASASSVDLVGAKPVFADIDYATQTIAPDTIAAVIGPRTKAIIPVHLNGRPCDIEGIMKLADAHGLVVIEDCAQSHGAMIGNKQLGSFGHAAAFSFCQDKIMTTGGEGGMVLFQDEERWRIAWSYKDHGKSWDAVFNREHAPGYRWVHESIGSNWRMLEMQAALGLIQLRRLDSWTEARTANAERIANALASYPCVGITPLPAGHKHAYYRLECSVKLEMLADGWDRDRIMKALNAEGIPALVGACPELYRELAYASHETVAPKPNAARLGHTSLVFLTHPTLDEQALADTEAALHKVFGAASK
ncbi:dTDP-4-amino-4,6-dideoxygalactose transaminase [Mesorhizobium albiziae]|uniref:dTDP-4-amino-4,6-dideoxygalactose transaminase n=2 Tax=Neomesorhizobium albiziae TaxID=335020 RepID=A0A1I4F848_9HYPH|nr:dTDP-4-amino-4,6-dideoxygalactose transaminase [Mesorhizobium albiziae]